MKGKYLVTTDAWFYAPDGKQYRAAWGEIKILEDSFLGIKTNRMSANWFAKIGSEDMHIIVAGCQINYSIKCDEYPETGLVKDFYGEESEASSRPSKIYIAE